MLDDLKMIHERDAQDALGIAEKQWQQLEHTFVLPALNIKPVNIVYAGMGGSALAASLSLAWPGHHIPFEVVRNYNLPAYTSKASLVIVSSYSGNTEETLSALAQAEQIGAHIAVITSGGKLLKAAQTKNYPLTIIPEGNQPRYAVLYNFKALVTILEQAGLVKVEQVERTLSSATSFLKQAIETWKPNVPMNQNQAKQLAYECIGKSVVIYSGPLLYPAAYKWKINFNENAKHIAWVNQYPELNHNEMIGWTKQPVDKPYSVIELRSNLEHPRVQKRFEVTEKLLSGLRPAPLIVRPKGEDLLQQLLYSVALGDFVSLYTALLNGLNPTPVALIEKFKKALAN